MGIDPTWFLPIPSRSMRRYAVRLVLTLAVSACVASEVVATGAADTTSTTVGAVSTSTLRAPTTTGAASLYVEFVDGSVSGPEVVEVGLGEIVGIWVLSDVDDELHVHGYDLFFPIEAGVPFHLSFAADIPGSFEVEVHTGHRHLFDIRVNG